MDDETFKQFVAKFSVGITVKDRKHLFKKYENCFVGSEAVDWIIDNNWANTRPEAVALGNFLISK